MSHEHNPNRCFHGCPEEDNNPDAKATEIIWTCATNTGTLVAQSKRIPNAHTVHFQKWAWLKSGNPDRLILYWCGLYAYTYHTDALTVARALELPPVKPHLFNPNKSNVGTLIFYEFHTGLADLLIDLTTHGQKIALIYPAAHDYAEGSDLTLFDSPEDVHAYVQRDRQTWIDQKVARTGSHQYDLEL